MAGAGVEIEPDAAEPTGAGAKLAAQVARRIEASIIELGWPVGSVLGSEAELRERYGVGSSVMREAVRLTEHHQVTRVRRGAKGGLVVTAPDAGPAVRALVICLEYSGLTVGHLMDARLLLEPLAAAAAAERVSEQDIDHLRRLLVLEEHTLGEPGRQFQDLVHTELGRLSGDPVLELFVDVLTRATASHTHTTRRLTKAELRRGRALSHQQHLPIVGAVIAGDPDRAATATAEHLRSMAQWLESQPMARRRAGVSRPTEAPGTKLAETVAAGVLAEIVRRDWPVGLVLGSEADLLARYGISRSVLREAVRLLEFHSVARMRRGPGGGLVVTTPDPEASVNTMALYLDYRGVGSEHLLMVRNAVELGIFNRVLARCRDAAVAERLEQAIRRTAESTGPGRTGGDHFHAELAELAGNPVLAIFLRILTELFTRHIAGAPNPKADPPTLAAMEDVHRRILAAVLDGDEDLARHRMRRHLEALKA